MATLLFLRGDREVLRVPCSDRKSTRLNSSHGYISYAAFCLKKIILSGPRCVGHDGPPTRVTLLIASPRAPAGLGCRYSRMGRKTFPPAQCPDYLCTGPGETGGSP